MWSHFNGSGLRKAIEQETPGDSRISAQSFSAFKQRPNWRYIFSFKAFRELCEHGEYASTGLDDAASSEGRELTVHRQFNEGVNCEENHNVMREPLDSL